MRTLLLCALLLTGCPPPDNSPTAAHKVNQTIADLQSTPQARLLIDGWESRQRLAGIAIPATVVISEAPNGTLLTGPGPDLAIVYRRMYPSPEVEQNK